MEITLALFIVLGATVVILNLGRFSERSPFSVSDLRYINTQLKYQSLLLGVTILVLLAVYFVNETNFSAFLVPGSIAAPARGIAWLGIKEGES